MNTNNLHIEFNFKSCLLFLVLLTANTLFAQPAAKGANKFLGNITTRNAVRSDFLDYWNQITPENESKWASVEGTRDKMNWRGVDSVASFARRNGIPWKFHTLIWGSQAPPWINNLSQAEQLEEITEWYDEAAKRYPDVAMIDVVNEAYPSHKPAGFKNALGGDGVTGFDWIIKAFEMARERWPKAVLIYNDYNNCEYGSELNWTIKLVEAMTKAKAPIDAIGCQSHDVYMVSTNTVKSNIDKLAATGLPVFITEYDIGQSNDDTQKKIMQEQITMFWNHPKIAGITYWGYIVGSTWRNGTGLKSSSGTDRPALTWLIDYVKKNPDPPNDFKSLVPKIVLNTIPITYISRNQWNNNTTSFKVFDLQGRLNNISDLKRDAISLQSLHYAQGCYIIKSDNATLRLPMCDYQKKY
jgi:endo-1,4-beta-xylanase